MQNIAILFTLLLVPHWAPTLANVPEALRGRIGVALAFVFSSVGHFIKTSAMTQMLGIGANTAIFSIADAVLLKPLPYDDPGQLVQVWEAPQSGKRNSVSPGAFLDWKEHAAIFDSLSLVDETEKNFTGDGEPERIKGLAVSACGLEMLRVRPLLGRTFIPEEDQVGKDKVIVLTHRLWTRRFGGTPGVVGQTVQLSDQTYTIIGVLPRRCLLWEEADSVVPFALAPSESNERSANWLHVMGRLKPGVRVERQLVTESLVLAALGGALAVLLAHGLITVVQITRPDLEAVNAWHVSMLTPLRLDYSVLGFAMLLSLVAGVLFGLAPALAASRISLEETLKESARGTSQGPGHSSFRRFLIVAEVALALMLLTGAGLMLRSFWKLAQVKPGFDAAHVLTVPIHPPQAKYSDRNRRIQFFNDLCEHLRKLPGVEEVGGNVYLPLAGGNSQLSTKVHGRPPLPEGQNSPNYRVVTPNYFRSMGIPLLQGRDFTERVNAESVAPQKFNAGSLSGFAVLALLLAAIGIYGVLAYSVSQRTRELGLRMALGAQRSDILRLVIRQGTVLAIIGIAFGLGGAFALTRVMRALLFEVEPGDPLTFVTVSLLLLAAALLACWLPARRAARVHPMAALRYE